METFLDRLLRSQDFIGGKAVRDGRYQSSALKFRTRGEFQELSSFSSHRGGGVSKVVVGRAAGVRRKSAPPLDIARDPEIFEVWKTVFLMVGGSNLRVSL